MSTSTTRDGTEWFAQSERAPSMGDEGGVLWPSHGDEGGGGLL